MLATCSYRYTDAEQKTLLDSITVLADTREQQNQHVLDSLQALGMACQARKLDYGDYACFLPANLELGILRDIHFSSQFAIERKASLEELSGNLTQERARFENELMRAHAAGCRLVLLVENGSWADIAEGRYKTQFNPKAFMAALLTFQHRYGLQVAFVPSNLAGAFIGRMLHYQVREYLQL